MTTVRILEVLFAALLVMAIGWTVSASAQHADLIIIGDTIHTLNPDQPSVEAVAITGQYIVYTGSREGAGRFKGPETRVLDVTGKTVLPGLVDAHAHLGGLGKALRQVDLVGTTSAEEALKRVLAQQASSAPGDWIEGRGWDQNDWPGKEFPTFRDLEGTEANAVYLRRVDGHAAWLNTRALEMCGITRDTKDPDGGRIIKDDAGNPTGVLIDNAMKLVEDTKPEPSFEERLERYRRGIEECHRYGLTGVHDAGVGEKNLEALRYLYKHGELTIRVYAMLESDERDFAEEFLRRGTEIDPDHYLTIRALKIYADGALGSRGAALLEPYSDEPGNAGLLMHPRDELLRWTSLALSNGFQVCTHAIGDAANQLMLDVYEEAMSERGEGDHRLRIEHAQILALDDIGRFKKLGVIASMQPTHATSDMYWAVDRLGTERLKGAYAWRKILNTGAVICCGSDFPVEGVNPLWGVHAAVTRQDEKSWPDKGWYAEECMTLDEAVDGFTRNAAYAGFMEDIKGSLQVGMVADVTVLAADPYKMPKRNIRNVAVTHTVVGGRVVYEAAASSLKAE